MILQPKCGDDLFEMLLKQYFFLFFEIKQLFSQLFFYTPFTYILKAIVCIYRKTYQLKILIYIQDIF